MTNTSPNLADSVNKEKLMTDVKTVLSDAEALLKQAASSSGEKAAELRERGMGLLRQAKEKAQDLQDAVVTKSKAAARATDDYVHDHPWQRRSWPMARPIRIAPSASCILAGAHRPERGARHSADRRGWRHTGPRFLPGIS
jgi:ElaB/YqjD/DUF883 family membrane-anchored ribosome-binding protein